MTDVAIALLMLMVANGAPVLATRLFDGHFDRPVDLGRRFTDGRPILGPNKTLRGVLVAVLASAAIGVLLGLPWPAGALFGASAMVGDLLSSFTKRRFDLASGDRAFGLDQLPESVLPLLTLRAFTDLGWTGFAVALIAFLGLGELLSRLLYAAGIRKRPY
ncbi:MAG: CDP-archaeol synthase [Pseudomonadales bacterium]|jgi:CDP-2,3-bis-(O-geranylgeranyl)-sn-glycerol synthase|nr:CDP-archaeol synthase [Pseudomonadales bacterium]